MHWDAWFTLAVLALMVGLLAFVKVGADLILVGGVTLLLVAGVLEPAQALAGLSNEGMVTVGALFVVAAGLQKTGAMSLLSQYVLGKPLALGTAQRRIMFPAAVMSAFLNNTPVVAVLMPIVGDWAKKYGLPVSKLLIPLSYAAILGGTCTLIGTSTNLVTNSMLMAHQVQQGDNVTGLAMFDIAWVGLPSAVCGIAFVLLLGRWLLPDRRPPISPQDDPRQYPMEMLVEPGSSLVGKTIEEAGLRHLQGVYLMEIDRDGQVLAAVSSAQRLHANDRLVFVGVVDSVIDLQKIRGLQPATDQLFRLSSPRSERCLLEAVVSTTCPLVGKTIREGRFRSVYNAAVIAVARNGQRIDKKLGDISLWPGDTLLLEAHSSFLDQQRNSRDFFLVSEVDDSTPRRQERAWMALAILAALVGVVTLGIMSMLMASMLAAGLMIISRCCSGGDARGSVDWQVLIVIASGVAFSTAMTESGAADGISRSIIRLAGNNSHVNLAAVYLLTMIFTNLITNNAAVLLAFPVAISTANELSVNHMPFVVAIMMAASASFATPISYQTNLMVFGPGGYRFTDYLKIGVPLSLLVWAITVVIAPIAWRF